MAHFSQIPIVTAKLHWSGNLDSRTAEFSRVEADLEQSQVRSCNGAQPPGRPAARAGVCGGPKAALPRTRRRAADSTRPVTSENRLESYKRDDRRDRTTDSESTQNFQSIDVSDDGATPDILAAGFFLATPNRERTPIAKAERAATAGIEMTLKV